MIRDRGTKKWVAMMVPEHVSMLRRIDKDSNKVSKPVLDEQEIEQLGIVIVDSLRHTLEIKLVCWKDGYNNEYRGIVAKVDQLTNKIKLELLNGENLFFNFDEIISVERL